MHSLLPLTERPTQIRNLSWNKRLTDLLTRCSGLIEREISPLSDVINSVAAAGRSSSQLLLTVGRRLQRKRDDI